MAPRKINERTKHLRFLSITLYIQLCISIYACMYKKYVYKLEYVCCGVKAGMRLVVDYKWHPHLVRFSLF